MDSRMQRALAGVVVVAALAALGWAVLGEDSTPAPDAVAPEAATAPTEPDPTGATPQPIEVLGPAPNLVDIDGWLNTSAQSLDDVRGKVTIVQFWTFGCFNCKNTLPHLKAIYEEHKGDGLEIVGVHAPEFSHEADAANVARAVSDLDVTWPVALDTNKTNFRSWQPGTTSYWPRVYVIDQDGQIRYDHIGEGAYDELADTVDRLLAEDPDHT